MASGCPTIIGDPAVGMTVEAYNLYTTFASNAVYSANQVVNTLLNYTISPVEFNVSFADIPIAGYFAPPKPAAANITYNTTNEPPTPPVPNVVTPTFDAAPTDSTSVPDIPERQVPNPTLPDPVGAAPTLTPLTIPTAPTLPVSPVLLGITIPAPLPVATFSGTRPTFTGAQPNNNFAFTPQQYTSALMTQVTAQLSTMLDGGTGLPASVIAALRARAYSAVDMAETRAVQQALEEYGALGFTDPTGILVKRLNEVRQNNQNQRNSLSRDIYIQDQQIAVENLRLAVTQGVALESAKMQAFAEFMRLSLDAAKTQVELAIQLFDAAIALFNANQQAYATDAQVFRDTVQAQVSVYQAQLEGQKLLGELNLQEVQIFSANVDATVKIFSAEVEAARAQSLVNQQLLDQFRAQIENATLEVREYEAQYNAFATLVNSDRARVELYAAAEGAFSTRVSAWAKVQDNKISQSRFGVEVSDLNLRGWQGLVTRYNALLQAERDRVNANVKIFGAGVDLYKADVQGQQVASSVTQRQAELAIERERSRTSVALQQAQIDISQLVQLSSQMIEIKKSIATVEAQLAASAMSAMSFHAGVTSSRTDGQECQTSFTYLGSA